MSSGVLKSLTGEEIAGVQNSDTRRPRDPESGASLWNSTQFERTWPPEDPELKVATIECWKYEDHEGTQKQAPATRYDVGNFHTQPIQSWLKHAQSSPEGLQPSAGFKIMLVFIFRKNSDQASTSSILRYDPQTNVTRGVFHTHYSNINKDNFKDMPAQFIECSHPLLLPLLAAELTFETKIRQLADAIVALDEIEKETGFGFNISDEWTPSSNYRALIRRLGEAQSVLFLALATISAVQLSVVFIRQKLQRLNQILPDTYQRKLKVSSQMLDQRAEFILSNIEHTYQGDTMKERMQAQQTVLFNLITQSDSLINVGLAKDSKEIAVASKQDSAAMKIIAILTTFFLPGTFMATFFAMPLLNWSQPSITEVATRHLWVYWAVTGPLTLTIMASVIAWAFWHNRHIQLLRSLARESVSLTVSTEEMSKTEEKQVPGNKAGTAGALPPGRPIHNKYSLIHILKRRHRSPDSSRSEAASSQA
ncbi:hypothetical protein FDECE_9381 [Fusarium decemcellulare]|nr:hypothetical protein FDECE_9381 [Fusarium decemcellulare]